MYNTSVYCLSNLMFILLKDISIVTVFMMLVYNLLHFFSTTCFLYLTYSKEIEVDRPRGVSLTKKVLYDFSRDFTCFDGSRTIPFSQVNDDFCDCVDGSDEPGTSACPNGLYHCTNAGFRPKNIPSSRVNDGICDCCDGSDEWKNQSLCPNTCIELWKIAKEELEKETAEANEGFIKRQEYSQEGIAKKEERKKTLSDYENQLVQIEATEKILSEEKSIIETKETQAKEERRKIMEAELVRKAQEENLARGARSFAEMDADKDASLTLSELRVHTELDPDATDGEFTEEEALTYLIQPSVDLALYMESVWPIINTTFQTALLPPAEAQEDPKEAEDRAQKQEEAAFRKEEIEKQIAEGEEADAEYSDDEIDDGNDDDDDDYEEEQEDNFKDEVQEPPAPPTGEELYYDDATREIIKQANEARDRYEKNQNEKKKIESEISSLKKLLDYDFGPDEAFQSLQNQCYEMNTLEYIYKLCPFEKTSQKPKNGGAETSLGRWGSWSGPADSKFSSMKYDNGQSCWNGPSRSTQVKIRCGVENKVLSVDEPSRCTYVMEFSTPCACIQSQADAVPGMHDEL